METEKNVSVMTIQKTEEAGKVGVSGEPSDVPPEEPHEIEMVVEVSDMRIEHIQHRKHERVMRRTLRWPIHSNTHRVTF